MIPPESSFNFCFWAKLLVAIPALPLIGLIAASFFTQPLWQLGAAALAVGAAVGAAVAIDRIPALAKKSCGREDA